MRYYNAVQAAREIGVSDKTIRNWIEEGKLSFERTPSNRLAIPESEVAKLKKEYARFSQQENTIDTLSARILELERRCLGLEQRVEELEHRCLTEKPIEPSLSTFIPYDTSPILQPQKRTTVTSASVPVDLPPGSMLFADFAEKYSVPRATFSHHVRVGIAGDKVETVERPKPGRPEHTERWLTPKQQQAALDYWHRHGVKFKEPDQAEE